MKSCVSSWRRPDRDMTFEKKTKKRGEAAERSTVPYQLKTNEEWDQKAHKYP